MQIMSWKRDWYDECVRIIREINETCQKYLEFPTRAKQKEYQQKENRLDGCPDVRREDWITKRNKKTI